MKLVPLNNTSSKPHKLTSGFLYAVSAQLASWSKCVIDMSPSAPSLLPAKMFITTISTFSMFKSAAADETSSCDLPDFDAKLTDHCAQILFTASRNGSDPSGFAWGNACLLYTSPSPRDRQRSRMPSSA